MEKTNVNIERKTKNENILEVDEFYSPANIERLKKSIAQMELTGGTVHDVNLED